MSTTDPDSSSNTKKKKYSRSKTTGCVLDFEQQPLPRSQRAFAQQNHIPRTTLQHWIYRKESLKHQQQEATAFFESDVGLAWLHRIVVAARFVISQLAGGSVQDLTLFLHLSRLDCFVASSVGTQHQALVSMEQALCEFGKHQRQALALRMPHRRVTLCEDETFHPAICLVALAAPSGFILVEHYAASRDANTWNEAIRSAMMGLNAQVVQCVSDQARALLSHAETSLGVHHSTDLFHILHELVKATALLLAGRVKQAQSALASAKKKVAAPLESEAKHLVVDSPTVEGAAGILVEARQQEAAAQQHLNETLSEQQTVQEAIRGISNAYHPISLADGSLQTAQEVKEQLSQHFATIENIATKLSLNEDCHARINKAKRLLPQMVATIAFFYQMLVSHLVSLRLPVELERVFYGQLFAGYYLAKIAQQQRISADKKEKQALSQTLLQEWQSRAGPSGQLTDQQRHLLEALAKEYADLFTRSSSCTEGRNAHLRQHHQSSHRLSERKLGALTVVHNYFIKRSDGTTAAERFFGQKHQELFTYLLETLEVPRRPAARRQKPAA